MDTRHFLDALLEQYDTRKETPAGLDAQENQLLHKVLDLAPPAARERSCLNESHMQQAARRAARTPRL